MDKDTYIKELENQLLLTVNCLEDIANDRWGWAWEQIISDARTLVKTKSNEHLLS